MKLKKEFIIYKTGQKWIVISTDTSLFSGMIRFNEPGSYIFNYLKEETTSEQIVEKMLKEYNGSRELIESDVNKVIDTLKKIGALEE